jgi:hypothetical protein
MKKIQITTVATIALAIISMIACKKQTGARNTSCTICTTCPSTYMLVDTIPNSGNAVTVHNTNYLSHVAYTNRNGSTEGLTQKFQQTHVPGLYGGMGAALSFILDSLNLSSLPNQVTFVHARLSGNTNGADSNMVNVKFSNTPTIVTTSDSLQFYLAPYGYTVQFFSLPSTSEIYTGFPYAVVADSMIISKTIGTIDSVTVGAKLFESELRSICFKIVP